MILEGCIKEGMITSEFGFLEPTVPRDGLEGIVVAAHRLVDHKRNDKNIPIQVMNMNIEPVQIRAGVCLATLNEAAEQDLIPLHDTGKGELFKVCPLKTNDEDIECSEGVRDLYLTSGELLNENQHEIFCLLLNKYHSVFAKSLTDLGRTSLIQHEIGTGDARPIWQAPDVP